MKTAHSWCFNPKKNIHRPKKCGNHISHKKNNISTSQSRQKTSASKSSRSFGKDAAAAPAGKYRDDSGRLLATRCWINGYMISTKSKIVYVLFNGNHYRWLYGFMYLCLQQNIETINGLNGSVRLEMWNEDLNQITINPIPIWNTPSPAPWWLVLDPFWAVHFIHFIHIKWAHHVQNGSTISNQHFWNWDDPTLHHPWTIEKYSHAPVSWCSTSCLVDIKRSPYYGVDMKRSPYYVW